MRNHSKLFLGLSALLLAGAAGGCQEMAEFFGATDDAGFDKVAYRVKDAIERPAAPNPPPVVAGIGGGGAAAVPTLPAGAPAGVTQEMVELGAQQYGTVCSACHGSGGAGTPAAPALNDAEWINVAGDYESIVGVINSGVPAPRQFPAPMPPRGGGSFNDEQVRALAAYVFALSHQGS